MYEILHSEPVRGAALRFFASPPYLEKGEPDHAWHSYYDLAQALELSHDMSRHFLRLLQAAHGKSIRTVSTPDGIVVICPHFMAQGLMGAVADMRKMLPAAQKSKVIPRKERKLVEAAYSRGAVIALAKMTPNMPPEERLKMVINRVREDNGLGPIGFREE